MSGFVFQAEQRIERPIDAVFDFFSRAENLETLTPPWLRFQIATSGPLVMEPGLRIDYRLRLHGLPLRWQSEITAWEPPHRFVDEQRRGPYRYWVHEHTFRADGDATIVRDHVRYDVLGGRIVRRLFVAPDIERIFAYRRRRLSEILETESARRAC